MAEDDQSYYRRRAESELELAQQAANPRAVAAHHTLAQAYLERVAASSEPAENA